MATPPPIDPNERQHLERAVLKARRAELPFALEVLVDQAISYRDELQRDDEAHKARLQRRLYALEDSIRRAREVMYDWPISDVEIEREIIRQKMIEDEE